VFISDRLEINTLLQMSRCVPEIAALMLVDDRAMTPGFCILRQCPLLEFLALEVTASESNSAAVEAARTARSTM